MLPVPRAAGPGLALVVALLAAGVAIRWNTFAAGGSDSHCYLQQAKLFAQGTVALREPLAADAPWPASDLTFAPAGFVPSRYERGASVPICPPGLSLVMAPLVSRSAVFYVIPALGGLAVWWTFALGRRMAGPAAGLAAAVLLACSPIFLFQVVQPMSDIAAMAWWLAAVVALDRGTARGELLGGVLAGLAILTRPNLSPLAAVITVALTVRGRRAAPPPSDRQPRFAAPIGAAIAAAAPFACGLLPGIAVLLALQDAAYGSPFRTGYGDPAALFGWVHVAPNLKRYIGWILDTHGPLLALAPFGPVIVGRMAGDRGASSPGDRGQRWLAWLCLALAVTVLVVHLPYLEFGDWWYIRFLLPALPLLLALAAAVMVRATAGLPPLIAKAALTLVVLATGVWWVNVADDRLAFRLQQLERHFIDAGHAVTRLPANAVVITVRDSGSVRFHGQRPTLLWESLDPDHFDRALATLRQRGRHPFLLLEAGEMDGFRTRFRGHTSLAELDWPPVIQIGSVIRIFDPLDQARFYADGRVGTEHLRSPVAPAALAQASRREPVK